mgnify:CR=1 FL=1
MSSAPRREHAIRVFAEEYENAIHSFKTSDDDRAPNYVLLPSGASANRVFIVGTLTEFEQKESENGNEYWEMRIVDPTGAFQIYVGQYEPQPESVLRNMDPGDVPRYVSIIAKTGTFGGEEEGEEPRSTLRPEHMTLLDEGPDDQSATAVRDRWVAEAIEQTLDRLEIEATGDYELSDDVDLDELVVELVTDGNVADAAEARYGTDARDEVVETLRTALDSLDE